MRRLSVRNSRFVLWLLLLAGLLLYLSLFRVQVERNPLRADEVDFYRCMQNVVVLGRPLYYAGQVELPTDLVEPLGSQTLDGRAFQFYRFKPETGILKETFFAITDGNSRYTYCLWHPPLYVYLGAVFFRVFHLPPAQANLFRYFHLVFVALMFGGIALLLRELYRPAWLLALSFAALFLALSKLSVAASVLIDYNGALAMCVVVWLAWAFVRADREPTLLPLVAVLEAVTLTVGLGVGVAAVVGLVVWAVLFHRPALPRHLLTLAGGLALFLALFWLFSRLGHFPFSQPFLHNFQRASLQTTLSLRFLALVKYLGWYLSQIGVVAAGLALVLAARRLVKSQAQTKLPSDPEQDRYLQETRKLLAPTLVLVALILQASLSADAYGFPKYIAFTLPLLFAFAGGELASWAIADSALLLSSRVTAVLLASLLVISLAVPTAMALQRSGGTLYMAGEQGFLEAAQVLEDNSSPGDIFLGPKDLSFYAGRKFVQWSGPLWTDARRLQERVRAEQIRLAAASQGQVAMAGRDVTTWLAEHAAVIANPGENRVYSLR